ncbi:MAG TPA: DUF5681 domain-containing protein [Chlamydiales bacterium]|jgi:hypothetical protein|nr:DUF5681 domain-containing protein [Chlamydiales bacterium]
MSPVNTGRIQAKGQFPKGKSGNPRGKPIGARHRSSLIIEQLFSDKIQDICKTVIEEAKAGDMQAARIILDRLLPPRKDNPIQIDLPQMGTCADIVKAIECIANAVGSGQISPSEGEALARIIDIQARTLELNEHEQRLTALERVSSESFK